MKKTVLLFLFLLSSTIQALPTLTIANQSTPFASFVGVTAFPFFNRITFSSYNNTDFKGTIDIVLEHPSGALSDRITCTTAAFTGFSHNGTVSTPKGGASQATLTLTFSNAISIAQVKSIIESVSFVSTGNSMNPQLRRLWVYVKEDAVTNPESFSSGTGFNNHYYHYTAGSIGWDAARAAALATFYYGLKGYLTTITNANENAKVANVSSLLGWMGASDAAVEGTFRWMDGPEAGNAITYTNWDSGEPNSAGGNEDYLEINRANVAKWNDFGLDGTSPSSGYHSEYGGFNLSTVSGDVNFTTINVLGAPNSLQPAAGF